MSFIATVLATRFRVKRKEKNLPRGGGGGGVDQFCLACNNSVGVSGDWRVSYPLTLSLPPWLERNIFLSSIYFFIVTSFGRSSQDMSCLARLFSFSSLFTQSLLYYPGAMRWEVMYRVALSIDATAAALLSVRGEISTVL